MNINESAKPIIVEQIFNLPVRIVWDSITKVEQMKLWFFNNIPSFEPAVGFQTRFSVQSGNRTFTHIWRIIEVSKYKTIKYHWSYEEYEGEGFVTFDLIDHGASTILRLINEGLESFPKNIPEFTRESCETGWQFFIKNSLKDFLQKNHCDK